VKLSILALVALLALSLAGGVDPIKASSVKWTGHFGSSEADSHTTFCLMARGAFRTPTKDIETVTAEWLKKHPNAVLVAVSSTMPFIVKDPQSKLTFVWIVDGSETLNLELVRRGCFHPATQIIGNDQKLEIPRPDYEAFTKKLTVAADYAYDHKRGLWSEPEEPDNPND